MQPPLIFNKTIGINHPTFPKPKVPN